MCLEGIVYSCNLCDHKVTRQDEFRTHQQSKHEGLRYSCNQCEYQATLQGNLKTHQQSKHEGVNYSYNQCEYQTTTQRFLRLTNNLNMKVLNIPVPNVNSRPIKTSPHGLHLTQSRLYFDNMCLIK